MEALHRVVRWVHVLAAASWLGEVVVINVVLLPILFRLESAERARFLKQIFPRVFRLASHLSLTTILAGAVLFLFRSQGQLSLLISTRWGWAVLIGGTPGLLLALFHFFLEGRLEGPVTSAEADPNREELAAAYRHLRIVPRIGLGVIVFVFVAMMVAAHGGW